MGRRFDALRERKTVTVDDALADPDHIALDIAYLTALGVDEPDELRIDLERELRASMTERISC